MTLGEWVKLHPTEMDSFGLQACMEQAGWENRWMEIYETELDAAGLYVSPPIRSHEFSKVLQNPIVQRISPEGGSFSTRDERSRKCLSELKKYLERMLNRGEEAELYASWADGMALLATPRNQRLDWIGDLSAFATEVPFDWQDGQYLRIKKNE